MLRVLSLTCIVVASACAHHSAPPTPVAHICPRSEFRVVKRWETTRQTTYPVTFVVKGVAYDSVGGPLANAYVGGPPAQGGITAADGSFRFQFQTPGNLAGPIRGRRIGYIPAETRVDVRNLDSVQLDLEFCGDPFKLDKIIITKVAVMRPALLSDAGDETPWTRTLTDKARTRHGQQQKDAFLFVRKQNYA